MSRLIHGICTFRNKVDKVEEEYIVKVQEKLKHYEDLEEAGRLIVLPCKIGDTVYRLTTRCDKENCPPIACDKCDFDEQFVGIRKFKFSYEAIYLVEKQLGKTVFLTKTEAEAKLEEMLKEK